MIKDKKDLAYVLQDIIINELQASDNNQAISVLLDIFYDDLLVKLYNGKQFKITIEDVTKHD